ncbi:MAG: hypothetical protein AAGH41_01305 [Pseudomonadota bacterium]
MTDRLTQIWKGFANTTQARLTSPEIGAHARPSASHLRDQRRGSDAALAEGRADASDAVQAAFQALHADIQQKAKRGGRNRKKGASYSAEPLAPPASALDDRLLADLKFTEARVRRSDSDYIAYASARQEAWKRRKKKFLGLF